MSRSGHLSSCEVRGGGRFVRGDVCAQLQDLVVQSEVFAIDVEQLLLTARGVK
jgi:hypothetical protein